MKTDVECRKVKAINSIFVACASVAPHFGSVGPVRFEPEWKFLSGSKNSNEL